MVSGNFALLGKLFLEYSIQNRAGQYREGTGTLELEGGRHVTNTCIGRGVLRPTSTQKEPHQWEHFRGFKKEIP